jgi:pimeloyl-ACP methyl ester carboxylesterase
MIWLLLAAPIAPSTAHATTKPMNRTGYATVNGLRMYYEEHGSGPPLVLLHGGGSTVQTSFGAIIPALARDHRVIAPEQQAHGHSGDRDRPLSFEQMADDTAALLGQLGVAEADVLGFSNGGVVAMQLAIRHPRLVRRLVLCSSYYARAGMPPQFWQGFAHARMSDMPPALRDAFVAAAPDPAAVPARFAKLVALMESFHDIPEASLRAIAAKTLVMVGDSDVMSVEHDARLARLLPHAELAVMPGARHGVYLGAVDMGVPAGGPLFEIATGMIQAFLAGRI